jgi:hypothetical protein
MVELTTANNLFCDQNKNEWMFLQLLPGVAFELKLKASDRGAGDGKDGRARRAEIRHAETWRPSGDGHDADDG